LRRTNPCGQPFSRDFQDKRLAANFAPLKIMAKNVGAISLA
jgi:hypothetical protein